jgi:rhodanese-related sulfurtransferase
MSRVSPGTGALVLAALGALYMTAALATGHSAHSEAPVDLSPSAGDAALDVWKAAALALAGDGAVVDVRPAEEFARYHVPGSRSLPGASAAQIHDLAKLEPVVVIASQDADAARLVREVRAAAQEPLQVHFLANGARAWYLAFELPVPVFSEVPPPHGYDHAIATVRGFLAEREASDVARREAGDLAGREAGDLAGREAGKQGEVEAGTFAERRTNRLAGRQATVATGPGAAGPAATGAPQREAVSQALQTLARLNYQPGLLKATGRPKPAAGGGKKISGGCG